MAARKSTHWTHSSLQKIIDWIFLIGIISTVFICSALRSVLVSTCMMCNYLRDFTQNTLPTINFLINHWSLLVKIQDIFRQLSNNDIDDLPIATEGDIKFDELPEDFKSNIQYAAKHAIAIYPPCMLAMLNITPDVSSTAASTKQLISQEFGLESDDWMIHCDPLTSQSCTYLNCFFYLRGRNDVYKPSFYLIRDDREHRYVLCIRGSTSVTDWITDAEHILLSLLSKASRVKPMQGS
eukprot:414140_1